MLRIRRYQVIVNDAISVRLIGKMHTESRRKSKDYPCIFLKTRRIKNGLAKPSGIVFPVDGQHVDHLLGDLGVVSLPSQQDVTSCMRYNVEILCPVPLISTRNSLFRIANLIGFVQ